MNPPGSLAQRWFLPWLGLLAAAALWWGFAAWRWKDDPILSSFAPAPALEALLGLVRSGEILPHFYASLRRIAYGVGIAAAVGIPLGLGLGLSPKLERSTSVVFQFLRMISPLSWMPLAVMLLGLGDLPVVSLIAMAAVWPILLNTTAGVGGVDPERLVLARSLCATRTEMVFRFVLPSIIAPILTGLRLAVGIAWIVLVPAEMLGVHAGLGYYILDTRDRLAYSELVAVILIIGVVGFAFDSLLRAAQQTWSTY